MTHVDDVKDLDPVMLMYNLIKSSNNYSKTSESFFQLCKDEPGNFIAYSQSFKSKSRLIDKAKTRYHKCKNSCAFKILK